MNRLPLDFVGTLMEALVVFFLYMVYYGKRQELRLRPFRHILFFFLFATMNNLVGHFFLDGISALVVALTAIGIVYGFLRAGLIPSVIIVISSMLIIIATEIPVLMATVFLTGKDIEAILEDDLLYALMFGVTKPLQVLIAYLLFRSKLSLQRFRMFHREAPLLANQLMQILLVSMVIILSTISAVDRETHVMYTVLSFSSVLILFALSLIDLHEREQTQQMLADYKIQATQIENMKQAMSVIRREKHDFSNHINTLRGIVGLRKENALESLAAYLEGISDDLHHSFRTFDTGDDYLDSLLALKYQLAQTRGVGLVVDIQAPFTALHMKRTEFISIMSNLIDNAFDAFDTFDSVQTAPPLVKITTQITDGAFVITISDNGKPVPMEISERIFEEGFSTKAKQEAERGYGLAITKRLVEQEKGTIQLTSNKWETAFQITLPVKIPPQQDTGGAG